MPFVSILIIIKKVNQGDESCSDFPSFLRKSDRTTVVKFVLGLMRGKRQNKLSTKDTEYPVTFIFLLFGLFFFFGRPAKMEMLRIIL